MIQLLPKELQCLYEGERDDSFKRTLTPIETQVIQCDYTSLGIYLNSLKYFQSVHKLKQEEMERIFVMLLDLVSQRYSYKTKQIFTDAQVTRKIMQTLKALSKKMQKKIEIDWVELDKIYYELQTLELDKNIRNLQHRSFERFSSILKYLVPQQYYEILKSLLNNNNPTLFQLLRVEKNQPTQEYAKSFETLLDLIQIPITRNLIGQKYLVHLLVNKPDLKIHEFNSVLEGIYQEFVSFLPHKQQQYQTIQLNNSIANFLVSLILPISKYPERIKVWELIERIIRVSMDLLHPNNVLNIRFVVDFLQRFIKSFSERVLREQFARQEVQQQKKSEDIEEQFLLREDNYYEEEEIDNGGQGESDQEDSDTEIQSDAKLCHLDEDGIQRFLTITTPLLKYLLYLNDSYKVYIGSIYKAFCKFRPKEILPVIVEQLTIALQRQDMKPHTLIMIYEKILPYLLHYENYPQGVSHVPFILRSTINYIQDYSDLIWRFYDILFQYVPIYEERDLQKECDDLSIMNRDDINIVEITQEISDLALEAFRKYIYCFQYIDSKYHSLVKTNNILFSTRNKFYNFIFQCSPTNYKEAVNIVMTFIDEVTMQKPHNLLINVLQAIMFRNSNSLNALIGVLEPKLLRVHKNVKEFNISNPLYLRSYLSLIAESISFTGNINEKYYQFFKDLINLSLSHEDVHIQYTGFDILSQLILSQSAIYIKDFYLYGSEKLNLLWAHKTHNKEKYQNEWVSNYNPGFLEQILNDFYYPAIQALDQFFETNKRTDDDVTSYVVNQFSNIIMHLNEPLCSKNMLQIDHKIRKELAKNLETVYIFAITLQHRSKQIVTEENSKIFIEFFNRNSYPCADNMNNKLLNIIYSFLPLYVELGLSQDQRIVSAYSYLIKALLGENGSGDKINTLFKWLYIKSTNQGAIHRKYKLINRYQKGMLLTYFLNMRLSEILFNEQINRKFTPLLYIWFVLVFDQNENVSRRTEQIFYWYFYQFQNQNIEENSQKLLNQVLTILRGQYFNNSGEYDIDKTKVAIFQKSFLNGTFQFLNCLINCNPLIAMDVFYELENIYQAIIDRNYKGTFNQSLFHLQLQFQNVVKKYDMNHLNDKPTLYQIKDEKLQEFLNEIHQKRNEYFKNQSEQQNISQAIVVKLQQKYYEMFLKADLNNSRQAVVYGIPLFTLKDPTLEENIYIKTYQACLSDNQNIRVFGRILLFRLIKFLKNKNSTIHYETVDEEEFKEPIPLEQFEASRGVLKKHLDKVSLTDSMKIGALLPYNAIQYTERNYESIKKLAHIIKSQSEKFIKYLQQDATSIGIGIYMQASGAKDLSVLFNDVTQLLSEKLTTYLMKSKSVKQPQVYLHKLLTQLFSITDFELFDKSKHLIDPNLIDDKDGQVFQSLYFTSLISAAHSRWPIKEEKKTEIIEFYLDHAALMIEKQSRELFTYCTYCAFYAFESKDSRSLQQIASAILKRIQNPNLSIPQISRWFNMIQIVLEQKKFRSGNQLIEILNATKVDFTDARFAKCYIQILFYLSSNLPHTIPSYEGQQKKSQFYLSNNPKFEKKLAEITQQYPNMDSLSKLNIAEGLNSLQRSLPMFYLDAKLLKLLLPLLEYLLTFNEENVQNEQETQVLNKLTQQLANGSVGEYGTEIFEMVVRMMKNSQGKVRLRQIQYLKTVIQLNITTKSSIFQVSPYLLDEKVQDSCFELVTLMIQQMTSQELENNLEKVFKLENSIESKLILMAFIMAHPRHAFHWTNKALGAVLQKCTPISKKQKTFAADFLKLYKANFLIENEEHQIEIEYVEKMSELSNPYNYFA